MNTEKQSFDSRPSYVDVHILLVDDDATSLAIVSTMLRKWKYQVATAKNPVDALATLRTKKGYFDLVITDLHMPYMDGFELQKRVDEEFKLPVIMMSADEKDSVIMRYLEGGVAFYIIKPVKPDDLKNVWQYAIAAKKGKSIAIEDIRTFNTSTSNNIITSTTSVIDRYNGESNFVDISPISSDLEENSDHYHDHIKKVNNNSKRKGTKRGIKDDGEETSSHHQPNAPRKAKVVWTNSLHTSFLMAISHLGFDKAVPKRILEFMNMPGLTRENVASHLQKYRLFLKKVAEKGMASMTKIQFEKIFKSSFANGHSSLIYKTYKKQYPELLRQYNLLNSSRTPQSSLTCSSHRSLLHNPNQQQKAASTSPSVPQQNTTQANTTYQQPLLGNTTTPINYQSNTFANGFNSISTYGTKGNSMPQLFTTSPMNYNFKVTTSGIGNTIRPLTDINKVNLPNSSTCPGNNFAGTRGINSGGDELIGFKFSQSTGFVAPKGNIGNNNYGYFEQVNNSDNNGQKSHLEYLPQYSPTNQLYGLSNILGGGGNNSEFQDNSTAFKGNSDLAQQFVNDDDFINMFLNHDNFHCPPNPNEQQSDEVPSDISDVTFQADEEMNPSENKVQDPHFSTSYYLQDNVPFEQSFGKVNEQVQNHENDVNMIYSTGHDYYPGFDRFNSQKQQRNEETEKHHVYKEWDEIFEALWGIDE